MFTRNAVKGDAVYVSQEHARNGRARAIIVNAGVSNVANGPQGRRGADEMCALAAAKLGVGEDEVLVRLITAFSTPEAEVDALLALARDSA